MWGEFKEFLASNLENIQILIFSMKNRFQVLKNQLEKGTFLNYVQALWVILDLVRKELFTKESESVRH